MQQQQSLMVVERWAKGAVVLAKARGASRQQQRASATGLHIVGKINGAEVTGGSAISAGLAKSRRRRQVRFPTSRGRSTAGDGRVRWGRKTMFLLFFFSLFFFKKKFLSLSPPISSYLLTVPLSLFFSDLSRKEAPPQQKKSFSLFYIKFLT